jgi:hypothetical protein
MVSKRCVVASLREICFLRFVRLRLPKYVIAKELAFGAEFHISAADRIAESDRSGNQPEWLLEVISLFRLQVRIIPVIEYSEPQAAHMDSQLMGFARNG